MKKYEEAKELISYLISENISKEEIKKDDKDSSENKHIKAKRILAHLLSV